MVNLNNTHVPFYKSSYSSYYFRNLTPEINMLTLYCNICNGRYKTKSAYVRHLILCHQIKLKEIYPGYLSHSHRSLLDPNNPDFYCFICEKTLSSKVTYIFHLTKYHSNELPELKRGVDCTNPSPRDIKLKLYCSNCNKLFFLKVLFMNHMVKVHKDDSRREMEDVRNR